MRRTTTKKLRNSPGVKIEGRTDGSGRNGQNPENPKVSPFASRVLGVHARPANGRSPDTMKFEHRSYTTTPLTTAPSPYRSPAKPGRAEREQPNPYRAPAKPAAPRVQSVPQKPQVEIPVAKAVPSLPLPSAASPEPVPDSPGRKDSPGKQRREMYQKGSPRGTVEKPPVRSMRELMVGGSDPVESRSASPRAAALLANQRKPLDEQYVAALVSKMKVGNPVEQQIDAVLKFLDAEGCLKTEGLHRVPGRQSEINEAVQKFESGELVVPSDAHVASGLLKAMFQQIFHDGETLIPRSLQYGLILVRKQAIADRVDPIQAVLGFFKTFIPARNMDALRKILAHLARVAEHSGSNKMDVENLAKLFGVWLYDAALDEASLKKDPLLPIEIGPTFQKVMALLIQEQMPPKN